MAAGGRGESSNAAHWVVSPMRRSIVRPIDRPCVARATRPHRPAFASPRARADVAHEAPCHRTSCDGTGVRAIRAGSSPRSCCCSTRATIREIRLSASSPTRLFPGGQHCRAAIRQQPPVCRPLTALLQGRSEQRPDENTACAAPTEATTGFDGGRSHSRPWCAGGGPNAGPAPSTATTSTAAATCGIGAVLRIQVRVEAAAAAAAAAAADDVVPKRIASSSSSSVMARREAPREEQLHLPALHRRRI
jgi:hypothetical protein